MPNPPNPRGTGYRVRGASRADSGASIAVVLLTIPLLTGPATISTMVIYAEKSRNICEQTELVGYGVVIGLTTYGAFRRRAA